MGQRLLSSSVSSGEPVEAAVQEARKVLTAAEATEEGVNILPQTLNWLLLASALREGGSGVGGICEAQGGFKEPGRALQTREFLAARAGRVATFDNRLLARTAKLAGAPQRATAGIALHVKSGDLVEQGQPLFTIHGESMGELDYAFAFALRNSDMIRLEAQ